MDLAVADGGDGGQHHVEAVEPGPAFEEMEAGNAEEDQRQQRQEQDLQIEQGLHSSHCVALRRATQQKRPSPVGDGRCLAKLEVWSGCPPGELQVQHNWAARSLGQGGGVKVALAVSAVRPPTRLQLINDGAGNDIHLRSLRGVGWDAEQAVAKAGVNAVGRRNQQLRTTQRRRIGAEIGGDLDTDRARGFSDVQDHAPAVSAATLLHAQIAVVESGKHLQRSALNLERRVMLVSEPGKYGRIAAGVWGRIGNGEIAEGPQFPQHGAVSMAIVVIDLKHPILAAFGKQDVAVRGELNRVGVQPIIGYSKSRIERRAAGAEILETLVIQGSDAANVLVSKRVPGPGELQVVIQHQNHVAQNVYRILLRPTL